MSKIEEGKKAPDFTLNDQDGKTHKLSDYAGQPAVLGVSILDEASKAKFAAKYQLNFPLLADADHEVAEKYGVWQEKSLYGRKFMGIARTTYLIGADGKIAKRWDNVKVDGHADDVLQTLQNL